MEQGYGKQKPALPLTRRAGFRYTGFSGSGCRPCHEYMRDNLTYSPQAYYSHLSSVLSRWMVDCTSRKRGFFYANQGREEEERSPAKGRCQEGRKEGESLTAMMYQESAPDGWKDKLADLLVEALVSPLHDQDVWTDEDEAENPVHKAGSPKKAHWHIVVSYKNPVTFAKAREVFDEIGAVVPPEPKAKVKDFQQMARYLCHLDQPKKHRYDPADVQAFGALDYQRLIMAGRDEDNLLDEMMEYIDENCITSFRQFCVYVRTENRWRVLVYHQYAALISRYIKSLAWEMEQANRR